MKISIVIPVYNAEKTIKRLLDSILSQSYYNYEIIVINDGSTDSTKNILNNYKDDKFKIITKENEGVGKARKIGFENATGDLIFFCDSDDYLSDNNVLKEINNKFNENNIDILMFDVLDIANDGNKIVNCFSKEITPGMHNIEEINDYFLFGPLFLKIFRREKLNKDSFVEFNNFEDTYTTYKYLNNCSNFYYEKDIYYVFDETANQNSLTKIKNIDKFINTIDLIELIYNESKLKESCCISTFNYYLYLISLIEKHIEWDKEKVEKLKLKMKQLEKIFLNNFNLILKIQKDKNIKKYINYKYNNDKKKIILIDGISTTGKSTISDKLYNYFKRNDIKAKWLHEESLNDINLNLELPKHEFIELEELKLEMENLYNRWNVFYNKIKDDENTYIIDSNFFKNIHDYMLFSKMDTKEIKEYYNRLIQIFNNDKIELIFLKRIYIKESLESAFKNRGSFWETHYKKYLNEKFETLSIETEFYKYEQIYQDFIEFLFNQFQINKLKITTDEEKWDEYINFILKELGLIYFNEVEKDFDYQKYIGIYSCENWYVEIFYEKNKLFLSAFWPKIELKYIGNNQFKLDRFPLELKFIDNKIIFTGDLIWDMKNKYFVKNKEKILKKINNNR